MRKIAHHQAASWLSGTASNISTKVDFITLPIEGHVSFSGFHTPKVSRIRFFRTRPAKYSLEKPM